jgi:hypothetical protein
MNLDKLEQLRRRRWKLRQQTRLVTCAHRKHILMRQDAVIRFPVRKYKKRLNEQGKKLSKEMFYRLVEFFNVYPPVDYEQRYHCEIITTYQNKNQRTRFTHVLKV